MNLNVLDWLLRSSSVEADCLGNIYSNVVVARWLYSIILWKKHVLLFINWLWNCDIQLKYPLSKPMNVVPTPPQSPAISWGWVLSVLFSLYRLKLNSDKIKNENEQKNTYSYFPSPSFPVHNFQCANINNLFTFPIQHLDTPS